MSLTAEDLRKITGLTPAMAEQCFQKNGTYDAALASFAQCFQKLPDNAFESKNVALNNKHLINTQLKAIYARAREAKRASANKSDAEVWKALESEKSATLTAPPPAKETAPTPTPAAAPATSSGKQPVFAFGAQPSTAPAPAAGGKGIAFSFGTGAPASGDGKPKEGEEKKDDNAAVASKTEAKKVTYCQPTHFTGPYFDMPKFWEGEVVAKAPLFNEDEGFLARNKDLLRARLEKWLSKTGFFKKPVKYVAMDDEDEEVVRVIIKDADRTFYMPEHRQKLVAFLNALYHEFNSYGQAMSYLAGLCLLVLDEEETASIIRFVATEYIKGHWAAEAVGFATSAWVVEAFMQIFYKDVAEHLLKLNFWPDTYLQKILSGLCIHVLPFEQLFRFLDAFMAGGFKYLIQFSLAIVDHFRSQLLAIKDTNDANTLYEIMRLDKSTCSMADVNAILERAPKIELGEAGSNIETIRYEVYEKRVAPRIKRAPKVATFEPCDICDVNRPVWYSDDVGTVCEECKKKFPDVTFEKY